MFLFWKRKTINYEEILSVLAEGQESKLKDLLWKYSETKYRPSIPLSLLLRLKQTDGASTSLKIYQRHRKGHFELLIIDVPAENSEKPDSPIILAKRNGQIAGILLPFNEIIPLLSKKENSDIGNLAVKWVTFSMNLKG